MPTLKNQQWELFAQGIALGKTKVDAYRDAGYTATDENNARSTAACRLARKPEVAVRIQELIDASASEAVLTIKERKEILSELAKGKLADYATVEGDISTIAYDDKSPNPRAVQSITVKRQVYANKKGDEGETTTTKIALVNPVQAIHELNKMEGAHAAEKHELSGDIGLTFEGREDGTKPPKPPAT